MTPPAIPKTPWSSNRPSPCWRRWAGRRSTPISEFDHGASTLGRETKAEVILKARLRLALQRLNPDAPPEAINQAIEELTRDRSRMSSVAANREIYHLLKNGVRVPVPDPEGDGETVEVVRVVDWDDPDQ